MLSQSEEGVIQDLNRPSVQLCHSETHRAKSDAQPLSLRPNHRDQIAPKRHVRPEDCAPSCSMVGERYLFVSVLNCTVTMSTKLPPLFCSPHVDVDGTSAYDPNSPLHLGQVFLNGVGDMSGHSRTRILCSFFLRLCVCSF